MACMFMSDRHAIENMKRYPDQIWPFIQAEIKLSHTWKKRKGLEELWEQCHDIDDVEDKSDSGRDYRQISFDDYPEVMP